VIATVEDSVTVRDILAANGQPSRSAPPGGAFAMAT
jgi:hypothetical protein